MDREDPRRFLLFGGRASRDSGRRAPEARWDGERGRGRSTSNEASLPEGPGDDSQRATSFPGADRRPSRFPGGARRQAGGLRKIRRQGPGVGLHRSLVSHEARTTWGCTVRTSPLPIRGRRCPLPAGRGEACEQRGSCHHPGRGLGPLPRRRAGANGRATRAATVALRRSQPGPMRGWLTRPMMLRRGIAPYIRESLLWPRLSPTTK